MIRLDLWEGDRPCRHCKDGMINDGPAHFGGADVFSRCDCQPVPEMPELAEAVREMRLANNRADDLRDQFEGESI